MEYRLRKGLHFRVRGRGEYVIEGRLPSGELQVKDVSSNEYKSLQEGSFIDSLFDGSLEILGDGQESPLAQRKAIRLIADDLSLLSEDLRQKTKRRYCYVREIQDQHLKCLTRETLSPVIKKINGEINDTSPPSWKTLGRWFKQYRASGEDIRSLIPAYQRRGNRRPKFSGREPEKAVAVAKIIEAVIAERYLTKHRPTVASICDTINARIASENNFRDKADLLMFPHKSSIYDIVNRLDPYEVMKARYNRRIADQKYAASRQGPRPSRPLERVEMDHTKLDMLVVDPETRLPVGRPWITVALDKYSRMIVGMYIGFDPPSYLSVMQCLRHAIQPKNYVKERYPDIKSTWDVYGIPEYLVVDNGPEFHSTDLEDACLQLGIVIDYAPPKCGQYKGSVERFFRTQNQKLLHGQPGTTFSNIIDRAEYDPQKNAVISFRAFEEIIHNFIVDVYHQTLHRDIQNTPAQVWKVAITEHPPPLPPRSSDLNVLLGCIEMRTISHVGIELHSLRYNGEDLARLRRTLKPRERIQVKYDPADLSLIHIANKDSGQYIPVPAVNQSYTKNLTLWQHKIIKRFAKQIGKDNSNIIDLCLAKERIQEIIEREWLTTKRTQTRQKLARFKNYGQRPPASTQWSIQDKEREELPPNQPSRSLLPLRKDGTRRQGQELTVPLKRASSGLRVTTLSQKGTQPDSDIEISLTDNKHDNVADLDMVGWEGDYDLPR